jgi:hypothetical protein
MMNKRHFLAAGAAAATLLPGGASAANAPANLRQPALLTVTGAIGKSNRAAFDPVLDQMMAKQKLSFSQAFAFDFAALRALPAVGIRPTLEYDGKPHALRGPLLATVLKAAGLQADNVKLAMRAIDGYAPTISLADAIRMRFIVATELDGKPMPLGGLGPLWAVYDADRVPEMAAKPVNERFALCPWGLYHIDVQQGA